jgi:hypothetical protein
MKAAFVAILFVASAFSQTAPTAPPAACGRANISFKVKLDHSQHTAQLPEPGKARVYFFSDAGTNASLAYPTVKVGMDGTWAGANHGNSYFSVSVDPGEHHICITLQSSLALPRVELAHFTAEADQVYYYRTRLIVSRGLELLELEPIDSDQGKYLILTFPLAVSSPKK